MSLTIQNLISTMIKEKNNEKLNEEDDFILLEKANGRWSCLFDTYFLSPETRLTEISTNATHSDDLIFYVRRKTDNSPKTNVVEVVRHHDTKRHPKLGSTDYDWEETTNLNFILHQFEYIVTVAVCIRAPDNHLVVLKRLALKVYANPSSHSVDTKAKQEKITFPYIHFAVDNFEEAFSEMTLSEGQMVCVELVAKNPNSNICKVLFLGSIRYEALKAVYDNRAKTSTRMAEKMSLQMYTKERVEFLRMRGPHNKGHAEMAVNLYQPLSSGRKSSESSLTTSNSYEKNQNEYSTNENVSVGQTVLPISESQEQQQTTPNTTMPETESDDIRRESVDQSGNFLGRTLNQVYSWVRGASSRLNQTTQTTVLQTSLTCLILTCKSIVHDILESNAEPKFLVD